MGLKKKKPSCMMHNEIQKLYDCRLLTNDWECEQFDIALENLSDLTDRKFIIDLCRVFEDNTHEEEVMFGLVHLIESFDKSDYLSELPKALPKMNDNAREWAILLNIRILNDNLYRIEYANILKNE